MKFERVDGGLQASVVKKPKSRKFFARAGVGFIRLSSKECREPLTACSKHHHSSPRSRLTNKVIQSMIFRDFKFRDTVIWDFRQSDAFDCFMAGVEGGDCLLRELVVTVYSNRSSNEQPSATRMLIPRMGQQE